MSLEDLLATLPEAHRKHLDPASPLPMRAMASKGMAPTPPREMVIILCGLTYDDDPRLSESASQSLAKLPDKILGPAIEADLPAAAFEVLAPTLTFKEGLLEKVVLNPSTPDTVMAGLAPGASEKIAEIILANQERCLRSEELVRAVKQNENVPRASLDRLFDFLVRAGVIYEDMAEFGEALARLSPTEREEAADKIELPAAALALTDHDRDEGFDAKLFARQMDSPAADPEGKTERIPMLKLIASLSVPQKISLAIKGNKEARSVLLRDSNRLVAVAVVRSPRITEPEVLTAAQSRSASDDVIRIIAASREMTRSYGVKVALVNNPKAPLPVAMRFLTLLRQNDQRAVARSKNVSAAIANHAKKLLLAKSSGR